MYREKITGFIEFPDATLFIPKNGGLYDYVNKILPESGLDQERIESLSKGGLLEVILARGEDIPQRVAEYNRQGKKAYGLTGDDLFDEYLMNQRELKEQVRLAVLNTYDWFDEKAEFRKPALCLMAKTEDILDGDTRGLKVAVNKKYFQTSYEYLQKRLGRKPRITSYSGDTEASVKDGINDCCIDIVYSGKSRKANGLKIVEPIRFSDIVLIGQDIDFLGKMFSVDYRSVNNRRSCPDSRTYSLLRNKKLRRDKLVSEAAEVFSAIEGNGNLQEEIADLLYAINVVMVGEKVDPREIAEIMQERVK